MRRTRTDTDQHGLTRTPTVVAGPAFSRPCWSVSVRVSVPPPSHLQDLLLFLLERGVDLGDVVVVELLDLVEAAALVVLADRLVLLHLLELVVAFAAGLAHAVAGVLGQIVRFLDD